MKLENHLTTLETSGLIRLAQLDSELEYLQKAYDRVMIVASKTKDETLRKSWLENVRDNSEIIAEWNTRKLILNSE